MSYASGREEQQGEPVQPQDRVGSTGPVLGGPRRERPGDMPVIGVPSTARPPSTPAGSTPARRSSAGPPASRTPAPASSVVAVFGDTRRVGPWQVGASTHVVSVFGDVFLDLREAQFDAAVSTIRVYLGFGDLKVVVRPGTAVEMRGFSVFGDQVSDAATQARADAPTVVLDMVGGFSDVRVRTLAVGEEISSWRRWLKALRRGTC